MKITPKFRKGDIIRHKMSTIALYIILKVDYESLKYTIVNISSSYKNIYDIPFIDDLGVLVRKNITNILKKL